MSSTIRGVAVQVVDEIITEKNIAEQHDFAYITVYTDRQERFETHDLVVIEGNADYIVQTDRVTAMDNNLFEHKVACFENLARFDKVIPAERVFSRITINNSTISLMTLGDIFSHYKRELEFYENIDIDLKDDGTGYENVQIPLKEFSGGVNFTSIVFELFRRIKANPKVERDGNTWLFYPQYWYTRNNDISTRVQDVEAFMTQTNAEDYATQVKSLIKNGSSELLEATTFPSDTGFVLPKGLVPQPPESQLRYIVDSPILGIVRVVALDVEFKSFDFPDRTLAEIDITDHVVTKQEFDTLPSVGTSYANLYLSGVTKRNAIQFEIGSNAITDLFSTAATQILGFFAQNTNHLENAVTTVAIPTLVSQFGASNWIAKTDLREIKVRIEYIRERNVFVSAHRQFQGFMNETSVIHSQRDSRVEANRFKQNLDILANRMGNVETVKSLTVRNNEPLVDVFDYVGENVVVEVKNTEYQGVTLQEIKLSQNFVNANSEYAISRRLDPFTITGKRVTTNLLLNDFVEISKQSKDIESKLSFKGLQNFLKTFANDTSAKPVKASVFKDLREGSKAIHMPIMTLTGGNLSFHASFDSPRIAGVDYTGDFGQPIAYADAQGIVKDFNWFLTEDVLIEDDGSYPDVTNDFVTIQNNNAYTNPALGFPLDLDPQAAFAITYQINPTTDEPRIVIGEAFSQFNYLIKVQNINFAVYGKDTPYTYQDVDIGQPITGATFTFNESFRRLTFATSQNKAHFALVANGELMIGFNEPINVGTPRIYFVNFLTKLFLTVIATNEESFGFEINVVGVAQEFLSSTAQETFSVDDTVLGFAQEFFERPVEEEFDVVLDIFGFAQEFFERPVAENFELLETINGFPQEFFSGQSAEQFAIDETAFGVKQEFLQSGVTDSFGVSENVFGVKQEFESGQISEEFGVNENVSGAVLFEVKRWITDTTATSVWDVTVNLGFVSSCPTQQQGLNIIENAFPANNQNVDDRGRIVSVVQDGEAFELCNELRYRVELI